MNRDFIPPLKTKGLSIERLLSSFIFHDGTWWKIIKIEENTLGLRECTNMEVVEIIEGPGIRILTRQEEAKP